MNDREMIGRLATAWLLLLSACTSEPILGDNLGGAKLANGQNPDAPRAAEQYRPPTPFAVEAPRLVAPTWRYDFACEGPCARTANVRVSADGKIWAALLGGAGVANADSDLIFVELDQDGREVALYRHALSSDVEQSSPLLLDDAGKPYTLRWQNRLSNDRPFPARLYRLRAGEIEETRLPPTVLKADSDFVSMYPDGTLLEVSTRVLDSTKKGPARAARHAADGKVLWQTKDFQAVAQYSGSQRAVVGPLFLSDGSIALDELPRPQEAGLGLSVLSPDGALTWYVPVNQRPWPMRQLAAGPDGSLAIAGVGGEASDLQIVGYDASGELLYSIAGERVGYHSVAPRGLAVDARGDVYVAVVTGQRDEPRLSVCKVEVQDASAHCVALQLDEGPQSRAYTWLYIDMALAAENAVLLALHHYVGEEIKTSVLRVDLASAQ